MDVRKFELACFILNLFIRLIRLLFSLIDWPEARECSWVLVSCYGRLGNRFASFIIAIIILALSICASSRKLLDILVYTTIACESLVEVLCSQCQLLRR
jgi:hypothetical protein